jgi:Protein of unknown function (DUF3048) N-terminal domain
MSRSRLALAAAVVVAGGIGLAAIVSGQASDPFTTGSVPTESAAPTPMPSPTTTTKQREKLTDPLTGGEVSENEVIVAKVENIAAARPQVGLNQADIIFVQEVEGAQTRLIAVYHSRFPKRLGPIRSARIQTYSYCHFSANLGWSIPEPTPRSSARSTMPRSCQSNAPRATLGG